VLQAAGQELYAKGGPAAGTPGSGAESADGGASKPGGKDDPTIIDAEVVDDGKKTS